MNSNNISSDTPGEMYNVSDNGVKRVTSNKVPANTFEFDQNIVIKYGLNHANLVLIGQGLGKPNQILDSSSGKNSDTDIKFKLTDADLKRDGYNYKIYYSDNNLYTISQDYESTEGEVVHSFSQSSLLSRVAQGTLSAYANLADALKDNGKYDSIVDGNDLANYSQNFFVVYTPVQERKQGFYILSDNDPYRRDPVTKKFALPETTEDADKSGTDYFKMQGETGNTVLPYKADGVTAAYNSLYNNGSPVNYSYGQSDYDENGNQITHTPSVPQDDPNPYLSQLPVYQRTGYRIDKASYAYTDSQGKKHELTFTAELTKNYDLSQGLSGFYYSSDSILLPILNYLVSGPSQYGGDNKLYLTPDGYTAETTPYKVKITGDENWKVSTDESGRQYISIPADQTWAFDNTEYDAKKMQDPSPQILNLHYAPIPLPEDGSGAKVQIHYVDVTGVDHLNPENQGINYKLDPSTSKYGVYMGQELETDAQGNPPSIFNLANVDQTFDNTNKDNDLSLIHI